MTDIINLFLDAKNILRVGKMCAKIGFTPKCGVSRYMQEFISGPYGAGMFDIWGGTSAELFIYQMNEEFLKYLKRRLTKEPTRVAAIRKSPAISAVNVLNPFVLATNITHGERKADTHYDFGFTEKPMTVATRRDAASPSERLHARTERDQVGLLHMMARDDEASDPHFDKSEQVHYPFADARRAREARHMTDHHVANIGAVDEEDATPMPYHLLVLDSQMSVLNKGPRSVPLGMGPTIQRGEIVSLTGRERNTVQSMRGRVTLVDDYKLANDIFASDSKGFLLTSRL